MKNVKSKVKIFVLGAAASTVIVGAGHAYKTNALQQKNLSDNSIELNVEKQDRDTIKIYLSNFSDLAKSLQLSVKIDDGNVKFNEDEIKWLVNGEADNVQTHYKIDSKKKTIDFIIVSDEVINSDSGVIEICEIDVSKDESIIDKLFKSNDSSYRVVPNEVDGEVYSYVTYSTNKRISGDNIVNASDDKLTINTKPVISLKDSYSIVENKIILSKGAVFNIKDYVEAFDADGNEIDDIKYDGTVDNKKPGSYNIVCTATDSYGDKSILETTVIVEEVISGNIAKPVISGTEKAAEIIIGQHFDLEKGISAKDYMGRSLKLSITGEYDIETAGIYTLIYSATDRFGNTTNADRILKVKEKDDDSDLGDDNNEENKYEIPDELKDIINVNIVKPISGKGTSGEPLIVEANNNASSIEFVSFMSKLDKFDINYGKVKEDENYKMITLSLSNRKSSINLESANLQDIYLTIKVRKSNVEFMNVLNDFIKDHGFEDTGSSGGESNSGGGSGGSSSGGSGNSSSSDSEPADKENSLGELNSGNSSSSETNNGWIKNENGTWSYTNSQGIKAASTWIYDLGLWYYLNENGIMKTGWHKDIDGSWYYLNNSGNMVTGWIKDNNKWYYLNESGDMQYSGWKKINGKWYYFYNNGEMASNTVINGYKVNANGEWI
ncbi:immunoglobulin-like domain-containing protein [Clostridium butyricum]|uniref:immunoglobulin-like domain-containing protein n=1 Tax=Clostridium butyricum TaxID=1492 RepID=UPI002ABE0663|nr:immunoglobulin-like domain-containing protein [Clostridium butyricum]